MRKLIGKDIFEAFRIIKKAGLKEELQPLIKSLASKVKEDGVNIEDIGISTILTIIEIMTEKKAEQGIWEFLAGPFEMAAGDVAELDFADLMDKFDQLVEDNDLKRFFTRLSGLMEKMQ